MNAAQRYASQLYQPPKQTIRGIKPDSWYSPLQPVAPIAPEGTEPRGFQYYAGQNLNWVPRFDAEYTAQQLKNLAAYPLARICIESVKDILCKAPWQIDPRPNPGETRKHALERAKQDKNIAGLTRFFEKPDREHYWNEWLRPLLDDMLVIDAASILMRRNFNGDIAELVVLRGESIVRYIDMNGLTPMAPDPGYAQIWWGIPLVNLTTDQLLYKPRSIVPRNTVSSQMYGMSPTEQLAPELEIGWERLGFTKAYYTEGSIPGMMQIVPKSVSPEKMTEAMLSFNSDLAGNYAKRWQIRMVPGFADASKGEKDEIVLTKAPLLADAYDDMHTRRVTFGYGISPQRLMKQMNRASAEQADEAAAEEGTLQYFTWLKGLMDQLIQEKFGMDGYEWTPDPFREPSFEKLTKAASDIMKVPVFSPNEIRDKFGEEPRPEPEANQLGAMTANGWTPIGMNATMSGIQVDEKGKVTYTGGTSDTGSGASGEVGAIPAGGGEERGEGEAEPEPEQGGGGGRKAKRARTQAVGRRVNGDGKPHGALNAAGHYGFGAAVDPGAVVKYSEEEERDEHGRWTSGAGAASGADVDLSTPEEREAEEAEKPKMEEVYTAEERSHGKIPSLLFSPKIQAGPTSSLVRTQMRTLPPGHLDGLQSVSFVEHSYVQARSAAHDNKVIDALGVYSPTNHDIVLSSNKDNIAVIGGNTIAHEVGHHVHMAKLTDEAAAEWEGISNNGQHALISAYAQTNQGEHFAEVYRAYQQGGDKRAKLKNLEPASYKFMASLNRTDSKKLYGPGKFADTATGKANWLKRYDPRQVKE